MDRYTRAFSLLLLTGAAAAAADYSVIDVQNVPLWGDPSSAVVHVTLPDKVEEVSCDVLVAGAGMGGVAAALALDGADVPDETRRRNLESLPRISD